MPDVQLNGFPGNLVLRKVTIKSGASKSEQIATDGMAMINIFMPSGWDAASIGYEASWDGNQNDMLPVYTGGGVPSTTVAAASTCIAFPSQDAIFAPFIRLTSVTATTTNAVNQTADRDLYMLFRRLFS